MIIRQATIDDKDSVISLWLSCNLKTANNNPEKDYLRAYNGTSSTILVGTESDEIIGSILVGHDGQRGYLHYVSASPSRMRSGIGKKMVEAAEVWLRDRGIERVNLIIRQNNEQVTEFYKKLGYDLTPRIVMGKWINQSHS